MNVSVEIQGTENLQANLEATGFQVENAVFKALFVKAISIHADAVKGIAKISNGELVRGRFVSKPGDPPNTDTGRLIGSVRIQKDEQSKSVSVGSNVSYSKFLEVGTKKMKARPWLKPALDKNKKLTKKDFKLLLKLK